jgi:hypothetical protein
MEINKRVLLATHAEPPSFEDLGVDANGEILESEVFRDLFDHEPNECLQLRNLVSPLENVADEDYKELEFDIRDEMERYGKVVRVHVPRPPKYGDTHQIKGFGKAYVKFERTDQAMTAKAKLLSRRFNDRFIEVGFYSTRKFDRGIYD